MLITDAMYLFTNRFAGSALRRRIRMMNRRRSDYGTLGRYVLWTGLMGAMALACRHSDSTNAFAIDKAAKPNALPATSPTRALVVELEDNGTWYRHLAIYHTKSGTRIIQGKPVIVHVKNDRLALADDVKYESAVYVNGKEASIEALNQIAPEFVGELFVLHQWENQPDADTKAKPYQILIQTSPRPVTFGPHERQFFTLLQAAAISQHPSGESFMFTMNTLLEATFFHNKNALVERTKNEHLKVYDEFEEDVDIFVNGLPATPADVTTVHVREVARLYTKERPYTAWFRADNPLRRFELHIQTTPKRAKRDSSYYVFSPFYTGDF